MISSGVKKTDITWVKKNIPFVEAINIDILFLDDLLFQVMSIELPEKKLWDFMLQSWRYVVWNTMSIKLPTLLFYPSWQLFISEFIRTSTLTF